MGRSRCKTSSRFARSAAIAAGWLCLAIIAPARGDDSANAARLEKMTADQKEDLARKKLRFDQLTQAERQRLRELHQSIATDDNAAELTDTVTRYNRWLASLDPVERIALQDIKDPDQRIARIKELMQQQEERRFKQYFANLPEDDRKTIYKWLGEFVDARATTIREKLPPPVVRRIDEAPNDEARRRELFGSWQRWRREFDLPFPAADDYQGLLQRFSAETQKTIESSVGSALAAEPDGQRTPERQHALRQQRMEELVRAALYSRFFPQISEEELLKFYAAMKPDDPRRKQLDGKEGEELRRELQRMYNWEHMPGRGPGGWGGPSSGRGGRFESKDRGPKPPPGDSSTPPPSEKK